MIQREREKRRKLQAEEAQQRLEKTAQESVAQQDRITRLENTAKANRQFIKDLMIPEYLQAIIDEEQLKGAYVLWWMRFPYSVSLSSHNYGYYENLERYDGSYGAKYLCGEGTLLSRSSLVWNIGRITSVYSTPEVRAGSGPGSVIRGEGTWDVTRGYKFQSVDIDGSLEKESLIIRGDPKFKFEYKPIMDNQLGYRRLQSDPKGIIDRGGYQFPLTYRYAEVTRLPSTPIVLRDNQLNPDTIKQTLASTYLDVINSGYYTEVDRREFSGEEFWPFDRYVPDIK